MTSSQPQGSSPSRAYVWVWLPGATSPIVAGVLADAGEQFQGERVFMFRYARSYLANPQAISLWVEELPLSDEPLDPRLPRGDRDPLTLASCLRDAAPDSWGRRVMDLRLRGKADEFTYLLGAGSNRIGALDFQASPSAFVSRDEDASLDQLIDLAALVEQGAPIPDVLAAAVLHGTSIGGARPKALLADGPRQLIAKFVSSSDTWPVVQAEALAMLLAAKAGLAVARVEVRQVNRKPVLLVERFDRVLTKQGECTRRSMLSMLTILGRRAAGSWGASYADIAQQIRVGRWTDVPGTLEEMFRRLVFSIMVGNNDDHLRNHAAFWDGRELALTPTYDLAPGPRGTNNSSQAIAITRDGERASQLRLAVRVAPEFNLTQVRARQTIDELRSSILDHWDECSDLALLTQSQRDGLFQRQFLNPYIDYDEA